MCRVTSRHMGKRKAKVVLRYTVYVLYNNSRQRIGSGGYWGDYNMSDKDGRFCFRIYPLDHFGNYINVALVLGVGF